MSEQQADWDDFEDHAAALADAEEGERQAEYEHELAIADYFDELENQ